MTRLKEFGPWSEQTSSSGKRYYYNRDTEVSQWEKPSDWKEHEKAILEKYKSAKSSKSTRPSAGATNESSSNRSQSQASSSRLNNTGSTANGNSRPSSSTTYHGDASTTSNTAIKTNSPLNALKSNRDLLNNNDVQKSSTTSRTSNSHARPSSSQYGNNNSSAPMFSSPLTVNSFTNSSKAQDTSKSSSPYVSRVNLTQNVSRPFLLPTSSASTSTFTAMPTSMTTSTIAIGGYHSHHHHSNNAVSMMDGGNNSNGMGKMDHYQNQQQSSSHQQYHQHHHQHSSVSSTKASPLFVSSLSLPSSNGNGGGGSGRSTMISTSSASSSSAHQISASSTRKDSSSLQQINRPHEQDASQHGPVFREERYLKHYRAELTTHRRNWPSDGYAGDAKRYAEKNQRQTLAMNALDDDIKSLYSLMNAADVRCSLLGQKLTFVRQQIHELESKNPSI